MSSEILLPSNRNGITLLSDYDQTAIEATPDRIIKARQRIISFLDSIKKPPVILNSQIVSSSIPDIKCSTNDRKEITLLLRANNIPGWNIQKFDKKRFIAVRRADYA
jgi:hypothetical protein